MNALTKSHNKNQQIWLIKRFVSYVQGQEPEPKIREYFYYIDHQGMVCKHIFCDKAKIILANSCF